MGAAARDSVRRRSTRGCQQLYAEAHAPGRRRGPRRDRRPRAPRVRPVRRHRPAPDPPRCARCRRAGTPTLVPDLGREGRPRPRRPHGARGAVGRDRRRPGRAVAARRPVHRRRRGARGEPAGGRRSTSGAAPPAGRWCASASPIATRVKAHGDLAFLLEGDLKEAAGGLRDVQVLRAIATLGIADVYRPPVRAAHARLLDVRDALHASVGRRVDRLIAQERAGRRRRCSASADGDALLRRVSTDARAISYALADAWRAVDRWRAPVQAARDAGRPRRRLPGRRDRARPHGRSAPRPDPSLGAAGRRRGGDVRPADRPRHAGVAGPLRAGAADAVAERRPAGVPRAARHRGGARRRLGRVRPVRSGRRLAARVEPAPRAATAPSDPRVHGRLAPACVRSIEATAYVREVSRPDLLLVAALLHDVGKGLPGDHSEVGAPLAARLAADMGFPPADVEMIARLVRLHLLLPDVATRRDLSDPVTIADVAEAVGDVDDARPAARAVPGRRGRDRRRPVVSPWRFAADRRAGRARPGAGHRRHRCRPRRRSTRRCVNAPLPAVEVTDDQVTVVAADRRGLLADVAGALALHRLDVIGADTSTDRRPGYVRCRRGRSVTGRGSGPYPLDPRSSPGRGRASCRWTGWSRGGRRRKAAVPPAVTWHRDVATDAVVLEVRAADAPGLLYRITRALADAGADVRAARVATLGADVVDAFYLVGAGRTRSARSSVTARSPTSCGHRRWLQRVRC